MKPQIVAYLYFGGDCREAMEFYQSCLGGDLRIQAIKDTPVAGQFPPESANLIMHAELLNSGLSLMASDNMGDKLAVGNQIELMIDCSSEEELHNFFNALSNGGKVDQPVRTEFWGAVFGQLTDKFGIHWMFNYGKS
jgi:PhnB protein